MDMLGAEKNAKRLHEIFHSKPLVYDCTKDNIREVLRAVPTTEGLMLFFEEGETVFGMKRITFIGESGNLRQRLQQHFFGKSGLTRHISNALPAEYANGLEYPRNANLYIQHNMSFVILQMDEYETDERTAWKNNIFYTLSEYYEQIEASDSWLGRNSPEPEMIHYKLWGIRYRNRNEGRVLMSDEFSVLESMYKSTK